jgi:hypothetical protein
VTRRRLCTLIGVCAACAAALLTSSLLATSLAQAQSIAVSHSPEPPIEDSQMVVHAAWTATGAETVTVMVVRGAQCAAQPDENQAVYFTESVLASTGSEAGYTFTPEEAGTYYLCGYLGESKSAPTDTSFESFNVAMPSGSVSVEATPHETQNTPVTVTVSGQTEQSRHLYVAVEHFGCELPNSEDAVLANGEQLPPGSFDRTYSYTPNTTQQYVVCAFLAGNLPDTINAEGSASFSNIAPSSEASAQTLAREAAERTERERLANQRPASEGILSSGNLQAPSKEKSHAPEPETATLVGASLKIKGGRVALVKLRCTGGIVDCAGKLTLTAKAAKAKHGHAKGTRAATIGAAKFKVAPLATTTVELPLNAAGRKLLEAARKRLLTGKLTVLELAPETLSPRGVGVRLVAR